MPIDVRQALALEFPVVEVDVERGRIRRFSKAIGEVDLIYSDVDAARAAGYRDVVVPPTYFFSVELEAPDPYEFLGILGIDSRYVLHGEQEFVYRSLAFAGDHLTVTTQIVDVTEKKDHAMELITRRSEVRREGSVVAEARSVVVVLRASAGR